MWNKDSTSSSEKYTDGVSHIVKRVIYSENSFRKRMLPYSFPLYKWWHELHNYKHWILFGYNWLHDFWDFLCTNNRFLLYKEDITVRSCYYEKISKRQKKKKRPFLYWQIRTRYKLRKNLQLYRVLGGESTVFYNRIFFHWKQKEKKTNIFA